MEIIKQVCEEIGLNYLLTEFEWVDSFAAARNFNYAHAPADCDWLLWLDSDDELIGGENLHSLADTLPLEYGALWFPYNYARDEFGNCTTLYERERLLRASLGWLWKGRLHETVEPIVQPSHGYPVPQTKYTRTDKVYMMHNHLAGTSRHERNINILKLMHEEEPDNRRVWLYFGHQFFAHQDWLDAAEWYLKFSSDGQSVPLERFQAMCYCGKALREARDFQQATQVALMAVELQPQYIDGYLELAHSYNMLGDTERALHWVQISETKELIHQPPALIFLNPMDYTFNKWCLLADIWFRKGDLGRTIAYLTQAQGMRPVPEISQRLVEFKELSNRNEIVNGLKRLCVELLNKGEIGKLPHVLDATPYWLKDLPDFQEMKAGIEHYTEQLKQKALIQSQPPLVELMWNSVLERLRLEKNGTVLVTECGDGTLVKLLNEEGIDAYGIDPDAANIAKSVIPERCKRGLEGRHKGKYGTVLSFNRTENMEHPGEYLKSLERLAERVIFTTAAPKPSSPASIRRQVFSQKDIEELLISKLGRRIISLYRNSSAKSSEDILLCEFDHRPMDSKHIKIFLGEGPEHWNPATIKNRGCGGSETAAAWLARALAKERCFNILYARDNQIWDGVLYRPHQQLSSAPCHLFISSRLPEIIDSQPAAIQKWLWMHDVDCWDRLTPIRASQFDVIWALSHWHVNHLKRTYPWLAEAPVIDALHRPATFEDDSDYPQRTYPGEQPEKPPTFMILGNGIDTNHFATLEGERKPYRFIWVSSPDRGLEELLGFWPKIKSGFPEAELHIFYGWEYFDLTLYLPHQREFKARIKKALEQPGVFWRGRIGQEELAREMMISDAWLYPPHGFRETCCIAAMECQAAGVLTFYRENGALGETIGERGIPVTNDNLLEKLELLKDREKCQGLRDKAREWAMLQDWEIIAKTVLRVYDSIEEQRHAKAGLIS